MNIQEHIDKISWTFADKGLFVLFGFFTLFQIGYLTPSDYGLFVLLNSLNIWILILSDSFLMNIIQFGAIKEDRKKVNLIALVIHLVITLGVSLLIFSLKHPLSELFTEPRFIYVASYLPLLVLLNVPRTYCLKFIFRDRIFKNLFIIDIFLFGSMVLATLLIIYLNNTLTFTDMVYIYFSGNFISSVASVILTRKSLRFSRKGNITIKTLLKFGLPLSLYNSLHSLPRNLDIFIVQYFFSIAAVGVYAYAKTLFRFFEEIIMAANSIIYPVAVRLINDKNKKSLNDIMTKSISFMLIFFLLLVISFELGLGELVINIFLPAKYALAIGHFNLLIISSIALPFLLLGSVITASGKPYIVLNFVFISIIVWIISFSIIGVIGDPSWIPIPMILYLFTLGTLCFVYAIKKFDFKTFQLLRAFNDSRSFIHSFIERKK